MLSLIKFPYVLGSPVLLTLLHVLLPYHFVSIIATLYYLLISVGKGLLSSPSLREDLAYFHAFRWIWAVKTYQWRFDWNYIEVYLEKGKDFLKNLVSI